MGPDPSEFSKRTQCLACGTKFTASHEALEVGGFRGQSKMRWRGGQGGVTKFYLTCPACDEIIFVEQSEISLLLQRTLFQDYNQVIRSTSGNELPSIKLVVPSNVPSYPVSSSAGPSGDESPDPHKIDF